MIVAVLKQLGSYSQVASYTYLGNLQLVTQLGSQYSNLVTSYSYSIGSQLAAIQLVQVAKQLAIYLQLRSQVVSYINSQLARQLQLYMQQATQLQLYSQLSIASQLYSYRQLTTQLYSQLLLYSQLRTFRYVAVYRLYNG